MITALPEEVSSAEQLKGSPGNSLISSSYHADGWAVTQGFGWGCASCSHYSWAQPGPRWWLRSNTTDFALHCTAVQKCVLMLPGHRMLRRRSWKLQSEALSFRCSPFPTTSLGHGEWRDWKSQLRAPPTHLCVTKKGVLAVLDEDMVLGLIWISVICTLVHCPVLHPQALLFASCFPRLFIYGNFITYG